MKNKKYKNLLKNFLPLILGVFFILFSYYNFTSEQKEQLLENITNVNPVWIIISITGGLLSHLSRAYRWKLLLRPMGYNTKLSTAFMAVMGGYLANLGIPRSGEVLRAASVATYEDIPFEKVFGTIIAERALDVIIVILLLLTAIFLHTEELFTFFEEYNINPWISLVGMLVLIGLGILFLQLIRRSSFSFFVKIRSFVNGVLEGVKSIFHLKNTGAFIFHTFFIWFMYVVTFYILKFAFPGMEHLNFGTMLVAFIAGSFAISITNGGIGIYPIAIGVALSLFEVSRETGEAFGWVDWGIQTLLSIIVGGLSLILLPILTKRKIHKSN